MIGATLWRQWSEYWSAGAPATPVELRLTTHPVIAGTGRHLVDGEVPTTRLRLLDAATTSVGNAVLTYGLRPVD